MAHSEQLKYFLKLLKTHVDHISQASYKYLTENKHNAKDDEWSVAYDINQSAHEMKQLIEKYKDVL